MVMVLFSKSPVMLEILGTRNFGERQTRKPSIAEFSSSDGSTDDDSDLVELELDATALATVVY